MTSNYYVLNKTLVKNLGIETAFFLTTLVEADEMLADEEGWFYQTAPLLEEMTGLSNHKQSKCIEQLISLGILLQENKGMPMKRYFKLNYEQILNSLNTSLEKISNNKEININNLDKELSSGIDESTQPQLDEKSIEFKNDVTVVNRV